MSETNLELIRRLTELMDAVGFEAALPALLEAAHPDVELREDPAWPGAVSRRGIEPVRRVLLDRLDTLDYEQRTEALIPVDDKVVALARWGGRGKASGAQGEVSMAVVFTFRDRAITSMEFFLDHERALAAVGL